MVYLSKMKTDYYKRRNIIIHGNSVKMYPNTSSIAMNLLWRMVKYNFIKLKRK